jgi:carboxyl-terminal processing protease
MSKAVKILLICALVLILFMGSFSGGFVSAMVIQQGNGGSLFGNNYPFPTAAATTSDQPAASVDSHSTDLETLFQPFWRTWEMIHQMYVDQPVNDTTLMRGAIKGMLDSLGDEHTSYIEPEILKQENIQLEGEYEGIGAWVDTAGEFLIITSPMPNSPAEKAGLKPGDTVIKIDGEDMAGKDGNYALSKVLGPAGTKVVLTILHKDEVDPVEITITRAKIDVASVESKVLDNQIGYVQILTFGDKTGPELKQALQTLRKQDIKALIVDLRYNGGGLLSAAVDVGSQFLKDSILMYEEYGSGEEKVFRVRPGGLATDIPLIVLVNEGTASASEIVAGAIQDLGRGKLVGVTTYGKGSVQNWVELDDEQGAVRITIARWLTPNKTQINKVGLTPDVAVPMTEEDYKELKDPQLDRAVELLLEEIK